MKPSKFGLKSNRKILLLCGITFVIYLIYWGVIRPALQELFLNPEQTTHLTLFLQSFFPNWNSVLARFTAHDLLAIADSFLLRLTIYLVILYYLFTTKLKHISYLELTTNRSKRLSAFLYLGSVFFVLILINQLVYLLEYRTLYDGKLLFLYNNVSLTLFVLLAISSFLLAFFEIKPLFFSYVGLFFFLLLDFFTQGFSKSEHTHTTLFYVLLLFPLLRTKYARYVHGIQGIRLILGLTYLMAGLEKLLSSPKQWLNGSLLQDYLLAFEQSWALPVAESDLLCLVLSWCILAFQIGWISLVFFPKYGIFYFSSAVIFHIANYVFLGVGYWFSPWTLALLVVLPWHKKQDKAMTPCLV